MSEHPFNKLKFRGKPPATTRALEGWIQAAEREVGIGAGRLSWMVASGIVIAAIQRAKHEDGLPRFLIKGGAYLELRLGIKARATKDIDALFRGNFEDFLAVLDETLSKPLNGISFQRTDVETISVPGRRIKPRRFDVCLQLRGKTWRRIRVEVAADEAGAGENADTIEAPSLAYFGIDTPSVTAGIVIDYQVAQKFHACTDLHSEERPNDRVRDIVDLHLLKAFFPVGSDLSSLRRACHRLFNERACEAEKTGEIESRTWPPMIIPYPHWRPDFPTYCKEVALAYSLDDAVSMLNAWILEIDRVGG